jgi:hypothetical protein
VAAAKAASVSRGAEQNEDRERRGKRSKAFHLDLPVIACTRQLISSAIGPELGSAVPGDEDVR